MIDNYLNILEDSLKKKSDILDKIKEICLNQSTLIKEENFNIDAYDKSVDAKDVLIDELTKLDDGFESLYNKIKDEMSNNKEMYADQIKRIQVLISDVTEKGVEIQALELRNRDGVANQLNNERLKIGKQRRSAKAVYGYYSSISKAAREDSGAVDFKK